MMFLVKLVNNTISKNTIKTPFYLYFKHNKNKLLKKQINTKDHFLFKKKNKTYFFITPKSIILGLAVMGDVSTLGLQHTASNQALSQQQISDVFSISSWAKNTSFQFLSNSNLDGFFYNNIFDYYTGNILYKASGGCYYEVIFSEEDIFSTTILLPSGFVKKINFLSIGTPGRSLGIFKPYAIKGGWQHTRLTNSNPKVRGVAMNPTDHPNGGRSNTKKPFLNRFYNIAKRGK